VPVSRTTDELVRKAYQLADMEQYGTGPHLVGRAEAVDRINDSIANFWEFLTLKGAEELVSRRATLSGPTDSGAVDLPSDCYKILGLWILDGQTYRRLHRLPTERMDDYTEERLEVGITTGSGEPRYYQIRGVANTLRRNPVTLLLYPDPGTTPRTYRLDYVPDAPRLDDDEGEVFELPNSWWRWIEHDAAIGYLVKEESDTRDLTQRRDEIGASVLRSMPDTDYGAARQVQDVRRAVRWHNRHRWPRWP
jgi:hypothetical protein